MPQVLTGAPATIQHLVEQTVGDMNLIKVSVYLDDIIIFGRAQGAYGESFEATLIRRIETVS